MTLSRIILGLLAIAPMTGYDVKRHVETTIIHFWSADKAQIYRTLASLVADGYATVVTVPGKGAPARQEHRITPAGREVLATWLSSDLERQTERDPFLARLFFAVDLPDDELATLIARRRTIASDLRETLERIQDQLPKPVDRAGRVRLWTLENGLAHARAETAWLDRIEAELS